MADNLEINVQANTSQATVSFNELMEALTAVGVGSKVAADGLTQVEVSSNTADAGVKKLAASSEGLGSIFERVGAQSKILASGFETLGIGGTEAAAKVGGLAESLKGLTAAVPELLAIVAVLTAVTAAFTATTDAISDAATAQQEIQQLSAAVQSQGESWASNSEEVEEWLNNLALASGVLKSELTPALNELISAGNGVSESEKILGVAAELSAQKNISVAEATNLLIAAENGRTRGLVQQISEVKNVVDAHGKFSDILTVVNQKTQNALETATGYNAEQARLKVEIEAVSEAIGTVFIPILTAVVQTLIGLVQEARDMGTGIVEAFKASADAALKFSQVLIAPLTAMADLSHGDVGGAINAIKGGIKDVGDIAGDTSKMITGLTSAFAQLAQNPYARGAQAVNDARAAVKKRLSDFSGMDRDPTEGGKGPKAKKEKGDSEATVTEELIQYKVEGIDEYKAAQLAVDEGVKNAQAALIPYEAAVVNASSVEQENAAKAALLVATKNELAKVHSILTAAVTQETAQQSTLQAEYAKQQTVVKGLADDHDKLAEKMLKEGGGNAQEKSDLQDKQTLYANAETALKKIGTARDEDTTNLQRNTTALAANNKEIALTPDAYKQTLLALDKLKVAHDEEYQDEVNTYKKSAAAQVAYYEQQLSLLDAHNAADVDRIKKLQQDIYTAEDDGYKKQVDLQEEALKKLEEARKKALEEAQKDISGFLDDILVKHESFRSAFKSLWDNIEKQYLQNISGMITGSSGFANLFGSLTGNPSAGGSGSSSNQAEVQNTQATQAASKATINLTQPTIDLKQSSVDLKGSVDQGASSTNSLKTSTDTLNTSIQNLTSAFQSGGGSGSGSTSFSGLFSQSSTIPSFDISPNSLQSITGSTQGLNPSSLQYSENQDSASTALSNISLSGVSPLSLLGTSGSAAGAAGSASRALTVGGVASGILGGYAIGTTVGGLDGGNQQNAGFGGVLGGIAGLVTKANPLAGLGLEIGGALLGSLFGPHLSAANAPDIYDTQNYGQGVANLLGKAGANGTTFYADQNTNTAFNGSTGLAGVEELLAQGQATFMKETGETAAQYAQALSEFGSSATGSGKLNFNKNIGQQYVTGATGAGGTFSYTQLDSTLSAIEAGILKTGGGASSIPVLNVSGMAPNFLQNMVQQLGTYQNGVYNPSAGSVNYINPNVGPNGGTLQPIARAPVNITVQVSQSVITNQQAMTDLANQLSQILGKSLFNNSYNSGFSF